MDIVSVVNERFYLDTWGESRQLGHVILLLVALMLGVWIFSRRDFEILGGMFVGLAGFCLVMLALLWLGTKQRFNYAELQKDRLRVRRLGIRVRDVKYSEIAELKPRQKHNFLRAMLLAPDDAAFGEHVDITVVAPKGFRQRWRLGGIVLAGGLHLVLREPEAFMRSVSERLPQDAR